MKQDTFNVFDFALLTDVVYMHCLRDESLQMYLASVFFFFFLIVDVIQYLFRPSGLCLTCTLGAELVGFPFKRGPIFVIGSSKYECACILITLGLLTCWMYTATVWTTFENCLLNHTCKHIIFITVIILNSFFIAALKLLVV